MEWKEWEVAHQALGVDKPNPRSTFSYSATCFNGNSLRYHHAYSNTSLTSPVEKECMVTDLGWCVCESLCVSSIQEEDGKVTKK